MAALPFVFAAAFGAPQASAAPIAIGTVMVSTGNGRVTEFTQTGTVITQLNTTTGSSETTGSAFDSVGNFFVTDFEAQKLSKFDPSGILLAASFAGPFNADPESIAFDAAGNFYVGQADGSHHILKFGPSGALLATFAPTRDPVAQIGPNSALISARSSIHRKAIS
jgi:DNA-binding beta-propeller fold protein YncE